MTYFFKLSKVLKLNWNFKLLTCQNFLALMMLMKNRHEIFLCVSIGLYIVTLDICLHVLPYSKNWLNKIFLKSANVKFNILQMEKIVHNSLFIRPYGQSWCWSHKIWMFYCNQSAFQVLQNSWTSCFCFTKILRLFRKKLQC